MKPTVRYLVGMGVAIIAVVFVIFYREYMGVDNDSAAEKNANPLLDIRLNAIVTDTTSRGPNGLNVAYTDIDTKETSSFLMNYRDHASIGIGDTVTKEKGEKLLLIYRKQGIVTSVPIE